MGLALVELGLRFFLLPHYWRPLPPFGAIDTPAQAEWLARQKEELAGRSEPEGIGAFDAELGWVNRPAAVAAGGLYTVHAGGWRGGRDYAATAPPGVTRLVAFGESFTFCHEVADGETWEAQLEALEPRYELPNFGVGGYGTDQALLLARRELGRMDADVVLVGLLLENIGRNVTRFRPLWVPQSNSPVAKPRFVLRDGALQLVPLPFRERAEFVHALETGEVLGLLAEHEYWTDPLPGWLAWSATARLALGKLAYDRRRIPGLWSHPGEPFETTLALLEEFRRLARQHGARDAVVLVFPAQLDLIGLTKSGEKFWTTLLDELDRRGIPHLDVSDALAAAASPSTKDLYGPGHLSRLGNEAVARALQAWLAGWL